MSTGNTQAAGDQSGQTADKSQVSSGIRNQPGGSTQGGYGPYARTPANYAGGSAPNPNATITLHAQDGSTRETTTDADGAISDQDRQWLAQHGGAMPINQVPPQDKALVGTGTGAAAQMNMDPSSVGTKPLETRPPGSYNPNTGDVSADGAGNQSGNNNNNAGGAGGQLGANVPSSGIRNQPGGTPTGGVSPYPRTPANYAGGPGPHANTTITLHAQDGSTKQTTTDANGAISDQDRQWLAQHGGAMPLAWIPPEDKAIVGTGTGAAAQMGVDPDSVGTRPLETRPPGSAGGNNNIGGQNGQSQGGQGQSGQGQQGGQGGPQVVDKSLPSSGIRNIPGGTPTGGVGPYQRTPANYAGGAGPNANRTITLYAQDGTTKQTTTDEDGAISDEDRSWLAEHGGALPLSQVPPEDKAIVGTGTGAAAQLHADPVDVGTKPLETRPPGSYNPNTGNVRGQGGQSQ